MNELWERREWLIPHEAAIYLSAKMGTRVAEADVLRLALDGHLALSVHLPASVEAVCTVGTQHPGRRKRIEGLWELSMQGAGRLELESRYHRLRGLPYVHVDGKTGASVTRDGEVCQLPPDQGAYGFSPRAASALPWGSVIVVRLEALAAFAADSASRRPAEARKSVAALEAQVAPPEAEAIAATPQSRGTLVDDFLERCNREYRGSGKLLRKDIWTLARHKKARQFEHWQKGDNQATAADRETFGRILNMTPQAFIEALARRTAR